MGYSREHSCELRASLKWSWSKNKNSSIQYFYLTKDFTISTLKSFKTKRSHYWGFCPVETTLNMILTYFVVAGVDGLDVRTTVQSLRFVAWNMTEIRTFLWFLLKKADFQLFYPPKSPTRNAVTQKHPLIGLGTYENYAFMQKIRSLTLKMASPGLF